MIRIVKPSTTPQILLTKGTKQTKQDNAAYDSDPDGYRSGNRKFNEFKSTIYGDESVKRVLLNAQHGKCCYCEARFLATSYGDIEHYRPKGAVKQMLGSSKEYPGYYWLAYDWNNIFVSCTTCNKKKSILFPLEDEATRARSHHDNIEDEKPLFINPAVNDPQEHIYFHREEPIPITEIGRKTIESLKLRRPALQEARREWLTVLEDLRDLIVAGENFDNPNMQKQIKKAKHLLETAVRPQSQFSSMVQDFLHPRGFAQRQTPIS